MKQELRNSVIAKQPGLLDAATDVVESLSAILDHNSDWRDLWNKVGGPSELCPPRRLVCTNEPQELYLLQFTALRAQHKNASQFR